MKRQYATNLRDQLDYLLTDHALTKADLGSLLSLNFETIDHILSDSTYFPGSLYAEKIARLYKRLAQYEERVDELFPQLLYNRIHDES
jgi:hypothetical protein